MNPLDAAIVLANASATWFLAGLIWTIQIVHYPLFDRVGRAGFVSYETAHAQLITMVVGWRTRKWWKAPSQSSDPAHRRHATTEHP